MHLKNYSAGNFDRGASKLAEALWIIVSAFFIDTWIPSSKMRIFLLRTFGAKIGSGCTMKPNIKIKFPWKLHVGNYTWIGEGVWIDNLALVEIGDNVCISQGVFICTGSHNWASANFDLITSSIKISDQVWIGAKSSVVLGTDIGEGAVVTMSGLASGKLRPWSIYSGRPAKFLKPRSGYNSPPV